MSEWMDEWMDEWMREWIKHVGEAEYYQLDLSGECSQA